MVLQDTTRPDPLTLAGFLLCALLGGANVVAVKFSTQGLPRFYGAAVRFFAASILLFGYMALRRVPLPSRAEWKGTIRSVCHLTEEPSTIDSRPWRV